MIQDVTGKLLVEGDFIIFVDPKYNNLCIGVIVDYYPIYEESDGEWELMVKGTQISYGKDNEVFWEQIMYPEVFVVLAVWDQVPREVRPLLLKWKAEIL